MEHREEICLHFSGRERPQKIYAKQKDRESRFLTIVLTEKGKRLRLPEGVRVQMRVRRPDGIYLTRECEISASQRN